MKVVQHLLKMGANVHIKDRFDRTPLTDAIEYDRHEVRSLSQEISFRILVYLFFF